MARLSDYNTLVGYGETVHLGDHGQQVWEETFESGGRDLETDALILVEVGGMTLTDDGAEVLVNNEVVGRIQNYHDDPDARHTQMIDLPARKLNDGANEVQVNAVEHPESGAGTYDDFVIENMVCFFRQ